METIILIERPQRSTFADALKKKYHVECVSSGKDAVEAAQRFPSVLAIILDSISMRTTGERIAKQIKAEVPNTPLIHLWASDGKLNTGNSAPRLAVKKESAATPADVVLIPPFTARKLINTIGRLTLPLNAASDDDLIIQAGHFVMNVTRRLLIVNGQETALTPKEALLAEYFLRHVGETLDRKQLMEQVWQTNYIGDTRTLDVHVRWIRRVIEVDPGNPVFLKTVRGVGYRLDIPETPHVNERAKTVKKGNAKALNGSAVDGVSAVQLVETSAADSSTAAVLQNS